MRECIKTKAVCKFAKKIKIVRETYTDIGPLPPALGGGCLKNRHLG
jgi:hypothetical protein